MTAAHFAEIRAASDGTALTYYKVLPDDEVSVVMRALIAEELGAHVVTTLADALCIVTTHYVCIGCPEIARTLDRYGYHIVEKD